MITTFLAQGYNYLNEKEDKTIVLLFATPFFLCPRSALPRVHRSRCRGSKWVIRDKWSTDFCTLVPRSP